MDYVELVNNSILFIDENLDRKMTIGDLSSKFNISSAHFSRVFKFLTGKSIKKYMLSRKLYSSLINLRKSSDSIINIAFDYGFDYPEVFSRAFKREFGLTPLEFRKSQIDIKRPSKLHILDKELISFKGGIVLKSNFKFLQTKHILGKSSIVDIKSSNFPIKLKSINDSLTNRNILKNSTQPYYHIISCLGDGDNFELFYGYESKQESFCSIETETKVVNKSWYITFSYSGNFLKIYQSLRGDIESSLKKREIPLILSGIGIILIFNTNSRERVEVLVPVKRV